MTKHAKHGGSVAARDIQCPAWQRLSAEIPVVQDVNGGSNPAADEGSLLHACMEKFYEDDVSFEESLKIKAHYNGTYLTQEMIDEKLIPAMECVEVLMDSYDIDDWLVEPYVTISEEMGGSIDMLMRSADGKTVIVLDYKFGFVQVDALNNAQLQFYALAAAHDATTAGWMEEAEDIVLAIVQPNNTGTDLDAWTVNMDIIDAFESVYMAAVELGEDSESLPKSGPACKYCPAHTFCPVKTGAAMMASRVNEITADRLAEYLPMAEEVEAWAKEVKKLAHEVLSTGVPIKGYKLIDKRSNRVWNDPKAVEDKIRKARSIKLEEGFDLKLKSPAQLEKLMKAKKLDFKKLYGPLVSSVSSGTNLVHESHKSPAAVPLASLEDLNAMLE